MDDLPWAPAHALGLDEARLAALIQDCKAHGQDLHSLIVCRGGTIALEAGWWPYQGRRQVMHSIAKSFTSAAIGFALAEGLLSLTDTVISFFPGHLPRLVSANLAAMTVEDLLTMRAGHAEEISGSVWRRHQDQLDRRSSSRCRWCTGPAPFTSIPAPPATCCPPSSRRSAARHLHEYLKPRLFEPLGIDAAKAGTSASTASIRAATALPADRWTCSSWDFCMPKAACGAAGNCLPPHGSHAASVRTASMAMPGWVMAIIGTPGLNGEFFATGLFGQVIAVFPQWDIVAVVTSATPGPMPCLGQIVPLLRRSLPGILAHGTADPGLAHLLTDISQPIALESEAHGAPGIRSYAMQDNALAISRVTLAIDPDICVLTVTDGEGEHTVVMGMGGWTLCETTMPGAQLHHGYALRPAKVMAGARWLDENLLEMRWLFVDTVFCDTVTCEFADGTIRLRRSVNVNSGDLSWPQLDGVLAC